VRAMFTWTLITVLAVPGLALAQRMAPVVIAQSHTAYATTAPLSAVSASPARRSWIRYPLIGAAAGGIGLQLYYMKQCGRDNSDGCMGGLAPLGLGVVVGAAAGAVVELVRRAIDTH